MRLIPNIFNIPGHSIAYSFLHKKYWINVIFLLNQNHYVVVFSAIVYVHIFFFFYCILKHIPRTEEHQKMIDCLKSNADLHIFLELFKIFQAKDSIKLFNIFMVIQAYEDFFFPED